MNEPSKPLINVDVDGLLKVDPGLGELSDLMSGKEPEQFKATDIPNHCTGDFQEWTGFATAISVIDDAINSLTSIIESVMGDVVVEGGGVNEDAMKAVFKCNNCRTILQTTNNIMKKQMAQFKYNEELFTQYAEALYRDKLDVIQNMQLAHDILDKIEDHNIGMMKIITDGLEGEKYDTKSINATVMTVRIADSCGIYRLNVKHALETFMSNGK